MKKLLIIGLCLFCISNCFAGQIFENFKVGTDKTVGIVLIGSSVYYGLIIVTPISYAVGTVGLISGIGLLFGLF